MARARSKTQKTAPTKLAAQTDNQAIITRHPVQDQVSIGEKSRLHSLTGILSVIACLQQLRTLALEMRFD